MKTSETKHVILAFSFLLEGLAFASSDAGTCRTFLEGHGVDPAVAARQATMLDRLNLTLSAPSLDLQLLSRAKAAIPHVTAYLASVNRVVLEGDYLVDAIFRAMLSKQAVLILGPAGVSKTRTPTLMFENVIFTKSVRERIASRPRIMKRRTLLQDAEVDDNQRISFFERQITDASREADIFGSVDVQMQVTQNVRRRGHEANILNHAFALLDELPDAHPSLLRALFTFLAKREYWEGGSQYYGITEAIAATSNYYLPEILDAAWTEHRIKLEPFIDRLGSVVVVPKGFAVKKDLAAPVSSPRRLGSYVAMMSQHLQGMDSQIVPLPYEDLNTLQTLRAQVKVSDFVIKLVELLGNKLEQKLRELQTADNARYLKEKVAKGVRAELPYRAAKLYSKRMFNYALDELLTVVVLDWIAKDGNRKLVAGFDDVFRLINFLIVNGPRSSHLTELMALEDPNTQEYQALMSVRKEREAFLTSWKEVIEDFEVEISRYQ